MTTTTKISDFAQRIKGLSDYRSDDHSLRSETASAFAALLEIVVERAPSAAGVEVLQAEVTDLRRQKSDLEVALAATMTAWHKDKAELEGLVTTQREEVAYTRRALDAAHKQAAAREADLRTQLDTATKRAELAEATLESVRAAVAKPAEDKQDGRPKVGDLVPWSEVEVGALYKVRTYDAYPFRVVSLHTTALCCGDDDRELESYLDGRYKGTPIDALADFHEGQTHATLIARDLGTDPEAWRAAMREHSAKVGK